ncbi:PH domain-containing protein [Ornithinimicrobium avium]|uniref:PH domain-containing protein n=1 Tax=Ornithinimicrobium avium TaxID=2283195 RepID=A0A345NJ93_9MICO|nr:PH domain-containing protein [Ornithinimicrobium avium]AXH95101.1 PH domain-containing protein [Ornithinimicrobium avium]
MTPTTPRRDPYDTFRPVVGAWVAGGMAVACVVTFALVAIFSPMPLGSTPALSLVNRAGVALIGVAGAAFLLRYAVLRAVPSRSGLRVVNLFSSRDLEWAQIVQVGFSGGAPWAVLELDDTEELAVMAIQRSDGDRARAEASRLAALIEHHHRTAGTG